MRVPFTLRRVGPRPAQALLLLSEQVSDLLRLCARVGEGRLPAVHAVAGGFLIRLPEECVDAHPQTIRLRALCANLFVPFDAELSPTLLSEEAEALVRQRGAIFLPGGVLTFAPEIVLQPVDLFSAPRLPRRAWLPLPPRPPRADRLNEVILDAPAASAEGVVEAGGTGIGEASPRPGASGAAATAAGHTLAGLGRGLAWLGSALNLDALTKLGADMIEQGIKQAPRVSEAVMGKQEAALRELLRQFREGDLEDALRHALPLGANRGGPVGVSADVNLPINSVVYSLASLLGGVVGAASTWMTPGELFDSLAAEYRKAAEAAARRGDHRRAAFIYGKLLGEWRPAAAALERGGLHHDAATVYLQKLGDTGAAARAFEAAGEIDRALELYVQATDHVAAAELLTRAGEPERALEHYCRAAAGAVARGDHLAAGELMLQRARRPDLAEIHFRDGWNLRSISATSQGCLLYLLDLYSRRSPPAELMALIGEADEFFTNNGTDVLAAAFYNGLARRADEDHLAARRDELCDRALTALASRMRHRAETGHVGVSVVQGLLTLAGGWEPALVRDAEVALRGIRRTRPARPSASRMRSFTGQVTAVCAARTTGDVFVGFASGDVVRFDPTRGCVPVETSLTGRVDALSVDDRATLLVAVYHEEGGHQVTSFCLGEKGTLGRLGAENFEGAPWLSNVYGAEGRYVVGLFDGETYTNLTGQDLLPEESWAASSDLRTAIILSAGGHERRRIASLLFESDSLSFLTTAGSSERVHHHRAGLRLPWSMAWVDGVCVPPLSWSSLGGRQMEIAAVTHSGALGWAKLRLFGDERSAVLASHQIGSDQPYLAAALLPLPNTKVAGVKADRVVLHALVGGHVRHETPLMADLRDAVACYYCPATRELIVVCRRGDVVRVPIE